MLYKCFLIKEYSIQKHQQIKMLFEGSISSLSSSSNEYLYPKCISSKKSVQKTDKFRINALLSIQMHFCILRIWNNRAIWDFIIKVKQAIYKICIASNKNSSSIFREYNILKEIKLWCEYKQQHYKTIVPENLFYF